LLSSLVLLPSGSLVAASHASVGSTVAPSGGGKMPSCCIMPTASQQVHTSAIFRSRSRLIVMPVTAPNLPVIGRPMKSAVCVPAATCRVATKSPSAICSSIVTFMSGNPSSQRLMVALASSLAAVPEPPSDVFCHSAFSWKSSV